MFSCSQIRISLGCWIKLHHLSSTETHSKWANFISYTSIARLIKKNIDCGSLLWLLPLYIDTVHCCVLERRSRCCQYQYERSERSEMKIFCLAANFPSINRLFFLSLTLCVHLYSHVWVSSFSVIINWRRTTTKTETETFLTTTSERARETNMREKCSFSLLPVLSVCAWKGRRSDNGGKRERSHISLIYFFRSFIRTRSSFSA